MTSFWLVEVRSGEGHDGPLGVELGNSSLPALVPRPINSFKNAVYGLDNLIS